MRERTPSIARFAAASILVAVKVWGNTAVRNRTPATNIGVSGRSIRRRGRRKHKTRICERMPLSLSSSQHKAARKFSLLRFREFSKDALGDRVRISGDQVAHSLIKERFFSRPIQPI